MERNLFISLFRHKPNLQFLPEENFITESFVYILHQSLMKDRILFDDFIKLLNPDLRYSNDSIIKIETQRIFELYDKTKAIPDITISIDKILLLIEVKVLSDLNQYESKIEDEYINFNQIEKYQKIENDKQIFTLTLWTINDIIKEKDYIKNILWNDVYNLLFNYYQKDKSNFLIKDFINFLSMQNMIIPKISKEIFDCSSEVRNLVTLIDLASNGLPHLKTIADGRFYRGFNIAIQEPKCVVWFGFRYKDSALKMQIITQDYYNKFKNSIYFPDPDSKNYILVSRLEISNMDFIDKKPEEQLNFIKNWITTSIENLIENIKQIK